LSGGDVDQSDLAMNFGRLEKSVEVLSKSVRLLCKIVFFLTFIVLINFLFPSEVIWEFAKSIDYVALVEALM
jgi:hypothetical protein